MDPMTQDELLKKTKSKYELVSLMQKRAAELMRGMPPLVEGTAGEVWPTIVQEIVTDKIKLLTGDDAAGLRREIAAREAEEVPSLDKKKDAAAKKTDAKTEGADKKGS